MSLISLSRYRVAVYLIAGLLLYSLFVSSAPGAETGRQLLQQRMSQLAERGSLDLEGAVISSKNFLPEFYRQRDYQLAWAAHMDNARMLAARILSSHEEGLIAADYHAVEIQKLLAKSSGKQFPQARQVDLDILLSEALARYAYHLRFGKVNPVKLDADWNMPRSFKGQDPVVELQSVIDSANFNAQLDARITQLPLYQQFRQALAKYEAIAAAGGWSSIAAGETLKPGMQDARVPLLRKRLQASGDLPAGEAANALSEYDATLESAVKQFQSRHGLETDGVVGKGTLAAMNVPVDARIDQIRVNLDRARWVSQDIPETFVIVDIAGFNARLFRRGEVVWDEPAQVGKPYRKTPVFREDMTYLELNPTWTIPPTILAKDILPKMKQDPSYLQKKNMQVLTQDGKVVDPGTIAWSSVSAKGFPYIIRQTPGPHNALGRVKFMFPNSHFVYLHDTPSKQLFNRSSRAFSSGCIRVRNPFELAELLLQDQDGWDRAQIDTAIDSLKQQRVSLSGPVPVLLLYWTVNVDADGTVYFKEDIYQ
ncbi:MAG: L,D-transpeptidase family protein, partial [Gammaproteobacteria bacterium]|nr:L,D-transpeptidase family protein [Gammaproteobacteria bacterium]